MPGVIIENRGDTATAPPHNLDAERALLGAYLLAPATLDDPDARVSRRDLYDGNHQTVYDAILRLHAAGTPADVVTVVEALGDHQHAVEIALDLIQTTPHAGHAAFYAEIVREKSHQRRRIERNRRERELLLDPTVPIDTVDDLLPPVDPPASTETRSAADVLATWNPLDITPPARIDCGLPIDLRPDRVWMLAAPPGLGKTALVMQLVFDSLRNDPDLKAIVCNVEVSPADLLTREVARMSGISATSIVERDYCDGDHERIAYAVDSIREIADRLHFVDRHDIDAIERAVQRYDAGLVALDYLQRIRPRGEHGSKVDALDGLMGDVRRLASDGRCVLAVSSLARSRSPGKSGHEGGMAGLRGSGELEYGADSVHTIEADDMGDGVALHCHKNRHGPKRDVYLSYHRPTQSFGVVP